MQYNPETNESPPALVSQKTSVENRDSPGAHHVARKRGNSGSTHDQDSSPTKFNNRVPYRGNILKTLPSGPAILARRDLCQPFTAHSCISMALSSASPHVVERVDLGPARQANIIE